MTGAPEPTPDPSDDPLGATIARAYAVLADAQADDGHWRFELEADVTIPAEYVLLRHYLGEPIDEALEAKIATYIRRLQSTVHHGWPLYHGGGFNISATIKAYYALKMIGDSPDAEHMLRARTAILEAGGAEAGNVFTRIQLALFGAGSWDAVPTIPPELMLAPRWFPVHLGKISYWARTVVVPLLVICALQPRARNPKGVRIDELFSGRNAPLSSQAAKIQWQWRVGFDWLDRALKRGHSLWPKRLRRRAIEQCRDWVIERLNGEDGLGAIYPAMANAVMMLDALGFPPDDPARAAAREALEKLIVATPDGVYCQPCVSPIWDTALAAHAMLEVGGDDAARRATRALDWLRPRQVLDVVGDWADQRPGLRPGGWPFQYTNDFYPDTDDTAVVVMAMDRAAGDDGTRYVEAIGRGREWVEGMQCRGGGWGAFDADNDKEYLNNLPFADHGALLDPPTADVSARCLSMLAQLGEPIGSPRVKAALKWLEREQEADGSWFGRWGVNYVYGTWSVLCAMGRVGVERSHPAIVKAVDWLSAVQNADGGWGESADSYLFDRAAYARLPSTASQTAWAVMGLMAVGGRHLAAVERGIDWLVANQADDGRWAEESYTGGGFPRVFYLRYHGYRHYFPLWALARYRNLSHANADRVAWGM